MEWPFMVDGRVSTGPSSLRNTLRVRSSKLNLVEIERDVNRILIVGPLGITKFLAQGH